MTDFEEAPPEETPQEETPITEEGEPNSEMLTIPPEMLGGRKCKPGETLTLKVVSVGKDGVQAELAGESKEDYPEADTEIDSMATEA